MSRVLGIDLGTTNSAMAVVVGGEARIIANAQGGRTTPSVIGFHTEEDYYVGAEAVAHALDLPRDTVTSIKRFMGRGFDEAEREMMGVTYELVRGPGGSVRVHIKTRERSMEEIQAALAQRIAEHGLDLEGGNLFLSGVNGHDYTPEELSSFVLRKMKEDAELALGEEVVDAVITVPAYFGDAQRQATRSAGRLAGLNVLRIISEPTAAALAYGVGDPRRDETVLIFDLGGGTFDVSILQIKQGVFTVLATSGDNHLGGDDWDLRLMVHLSTEFAREHGFQLLEYDDCLQRLRDAAVRAKIALSSLDEVTVEERNIVTVQGTAYDLRCRITRRQFEDMTRLLRGRLDIPLNNALRDAGLTYRDLDRVVLVGGSTRIPSVRELVRRHTRLEPVEGVNPDEAVALGAAIQAGMLTGEIAGIELRDVTPLSLGIEVHGGLMDVLIPRNTAIPASTCEVYETMQDAQEAVTINVCQGERGMAADNRSLGTFRLTGIPPLPAGEARIEVSFDIDVNGLVTVSARELSTGVEQQIHITGSTALSAEEVDALVADARAHDAADSTMAAAVRLREEGDELLREVTRGLERYASRLGADELQVLNDACQRTWDLMCEEAVDEQANDALRAALDELLVARVPLERTSGARRGNEYGWQAS